MFSSGDSLLLNIMTIIGLAMMILVGAFTYSRILINRYSRVVSRLYQMSFKGADNERRRISSELHDLLGRLSVHMSGGFESLKRSLEGKDLIALKKLEDQHELFKEQTHQIVEYMYPRILDENDWEGSLKTLAEGITHGDIRVNLDWDASRYPEGKCLSHAYWVIKEIITNALKHAKAKRIQISAVDEQDRFVISITYKKTEGSINLLNRNSNSSKGIGKQIIKDRLSVIGGNEKLIFENGAVTHEIRLKYESPHFR
ncbi:hypothetical protein N9760_07245 [Schleiferiaceae bacterium]|nr:hypothetical protein [Schleiferiaceae bacterium]